jgi:hypothetical protein
MLLNLQQPSQSFHDRLQHEPFSTLRKYTTAACNFFAFFPKEKRQF